MWDKIKDFCLGKPKHHVIPPRANRKQRRCQQHQLRQKAAASNRRKHEGR